MAKKQQEAALATNGNTRARARDKRQRLVETAAKLSYEQGFKNTSLADIARESGVPLGNVYFYFKTKDAIGDALVDRLAEQFATMRREWDALPDPKRRIAAFIQMTADNREALARSGCPVGTLRDRRVDLRPSAAPCTASRPGSRFVPAPRGYRRSSG